MLQLYLSCKFLANCGKKSETFQNLVDPLDLLKMTRLWVPEYKISYLCFFLMFFSLFSPSSVCTHFYCCFSLDHPLLCLSLPPCPSVHHINALLLTVFFFSLCFTAVKEDCVPRWLATIMQNWKYSTSPLQTEHSWNRYVIHNEDCDFIYSYIHSLI